MDDTIYKLSIFLKKRNKESTAKIKKLIEELPNKELLDEIIIVKYKAETIQEIMKRLNAMNINFVIEPTYPYEVNNYRESDQNLIDEILDLNKKKNPYFML